MGRLCEHFQGRSSHSAVAVPMIAVTGWRMVALTGSTLGSAQQTSAITGMVYLLIPTGRPRKVAEAEAETEAETEADAEAETETEAMVAPRVLETMWGIDIFFFVAIVSGAFRGGAQQVRGTSG